MLGAGGETITLHASFPWWSVASFWMWTWIGPALYFLHLLSEEQVMRFGYWLIVVDIRVPSGHRIKRTRGMWERTA